MKLKIKIAFIFLLGCAIASAQVKKMSLKEAVEMVLSQSNEMKMANAKLIEAKLEVEKAKNNQYPNAKISGQWLQLTNPNITSNLSSENAGKTSVSQILFGNANVSMPVFNGYKIKNSIEASKTMFEAENYNLAQTKEALALHTTELFAQLYQAEQMILLFKENSKSAQQRTTDFNNLVNNGLLARNDLLKAQLQVSNVQIAIDNATKNKNIINYQIVKLLQLPESTEITIDIETIKKEINTNITTSNGTRNDLKALEMQEKIAQNGVAIAKSNYYPTVALVGGYVAFDAKNFITVTNAMNFGVGVSYDVSSIFKNSKEVKIAQNKVEQVNISKTLLQDKISEEIQSSEENYKLTLKQNKVYNEAVDQSNENYRIVKDKYNNGLSNTNDLLEADVQQLQAKVNLALSQAEIALKYYQLQFAKGNLITSLNLSK